MTVVIIMGVSGSGKTTIGQRLAQVLNWEFRDADDFHTQHNIDRMRQGIALTDRDRRPWLFSMQQAIATWLQEGKDVVLACSALKESYRQTLDVDIELVKFVYLQGFFELIEQRMRSRPNHFMPKHLLESQFETLEEPDPQAAIYVDASLPVEAIVQQIIQKIQDNTKTKEC